MSGPGGGGCGRVGQSPSGVAAGGMPRAARASCLAAAPPLGIVVGEGFPDERPGEVGGVRLRSHVRHSMTLYGSCRVAARSAHVHDARQRGVKTGVGMLLACIMHVKGVSSGTTPLPVAGG